ncbi:MAG: hypothetical protein PSV22_24655 [Pseudolabrys sp.]|nr:hypothetical protein [Pseudolabrys sp.]
MKGPAEIASANVQGLKPNADIPKGVRVERLHERGINSANQAGGYVDPKLFTNKSK